jgi:hypothetical protein
MNRRKEMGGFEEDIRDRIHKVMAEETKMLEATEGMDAHLVFHLTNEYEAKIDLLRSLLPPGPLVSTNFSEESINE